MRAGEDPLQDAVDGGFAEEAAPPDLPLEPDAPPDADGLPDPLPDLAPDPPLPPGTCPLLGFESLDLVSEEDDDESADFESEVLPFDDDSVFVEPDSPEDSDPDPPPDPDPDPAEAAAAARESLR